MFDIHRVELDWGGRPLILETGKIARQADGAVLAKYGETTVLRDEIHATKQAGQYRFLVACAGTGQVWAEARIGDQDQGAVVPCGLPPNAFPIQLTTTTQSDSGSVTIVPITSAAVAVAYQIAFG